MDNPNHLKYSKTHEWVELLPDGEAKIGLTDFAQKQLGNVVFINLPEEGEHITTGDAFGEVESVKAVSDIIAPVSGTVDEVNRELMDIPEIINKDSYVSWLIQVCNVSFDEELMDAAEYEAFCTKEE